MVDRQLYLKGQQAIDLWLSGRKRWNDWVRGAGSKKSIDFSGVNFDALRRKHGLDEISFKEFNFPYGRVDFSGAQFGEGAVTFGGAQFGEGDVDFSSAQFGPGYVDFSSAQFGPGYVDFSQAQFGAGSVNFGGAQFGNGYVTFIEAQFGEGSVIFQKAQFGMGNVIFRKVQFGEGVISFDRTKFGMGNVNFSEARFGKGVVYFSGAQFGEGDVDFHKAQFDARSVTFSQAQFGVGTVNFSEAQFRTINIIFSAIKVDQGEFIFTPASLNSCKNLDMSGSTFDSVMIVSGINSPVVLRLTHTRLAYPIDLDNANFDFVGAYHYFDFWVAIDPTDSTSFRRLKKLAQDSGDYERMLDFYAKEMRTAYWNHLTGPKLALYYLYDWTSDYGRSISRPVLGLIITAWVYAEVYLAFAAKQGGEYWDALKFSAGHILPIYPGVRVTRGEMFEILFGATPSLEPWWLPIVTTSQYLVSSALLFLIGLALRNRFRS